MRSIEAQKGLDDEIRTQIEKTTSSRRLEDSVPALQKSESNPKPPLLANKGLLPLATEILESKTSDADLATRATEFVRVDKGLNSVDEVVKGVGDLISEKLAENETLRASLRKLFRDTAKLSSRLIAAEPEKAEATAGEATEPKSDKTDSAEATKTVAATAEGTTGVQPVTATPTEEKPDSRNRPIRWRLKLKRWPMLAQLQRLLPQERLLKHLPSLQQKLHLQLLRSVTAADLPAEPVKQPNLQLQPNLQRQLLPRLAK